MQRVNEVYPEFFYKKSNDDNGGVFIQWHYDDCFMIMAGPKSDVERKKEEILEFLNAVAPKYVFNFSLLRFRLSDFFAIGLNQTSLK